MKVGDKILCIKDFADRFEKGEYYEVDHIDKHIVVLKYPLDEVEKLLQHFDNRYLPDNRIQFYLTPYGKILGNPNNNFHEYFSDRLGKLQKINSL